MARVYEPRFPPGGARAAHSRRQPHAATGPRNQDRDRTDVNQPLDIVLRARVHDVGRAAHRARFEFGPAAAVHRGPDVVNEAAHLRSRDRPRRIPERSPYHDLHAGQPFQGHRDRRRTMTRTDSPLPRGDRATRGRAARCSCDQDPPRFERSLQVKRTDASLIGFPTERLEPRDHPAALVHGYRRLCSTSERVVELQHAGMNPRRRPQRSAGQAPHVLRHVPDGPRGLGHRVDTGRDRPGAGQRFTHRAGLKKTVDVHVAGGPVNEELVADGSRRPREIESAGALRAADGPAPFVKKHVRVLVGRPGEPRSRRSTEKGSIK